MFEKAIEFSRNEENDLAFSFSFFVASFSCTCVILEERKSQGKATDTSKPTINFSLTEFLRSTQFSNTSTPSAPFFQPLVLSLLPSDPFLPWVFFSQLSLSSSRTFISFSPFFTLFHPFSPFFTLFHPLTISNMPQEKVRSRTVFPSTP